MSHITLSEILFDPQGDMLKVKLIFRRGLGP
jgi:hypothetical protein